LFDRESPSRAINSLIIPVFGTRRNQARPKESATPHEGIALEHDPEKWVPVFRKDHAQSKTEREGGSANVD